MFRLYPLSMIGLVVIANAFAGDAKTAVDIRAPDGTVLITADEIVSYNWSTHTITLKPDVRKNLAKKLRGGLVKGEPFIVAVGGKKTYEGTFTSLLSSASFSSVVIVLDESAYLPTSLEQNQVRIGLGYPGKVAFKGEDPRNDARIETALKESGKLALSPADYLKLLAKHKDRKTFSSVLEGATVAPVKEQDLPELFKLLDSKEKCAATILLGSSVAPAEGSTVGHEAAVLIDSFRTSKRYPIANTSTEHQVDREALLKWWKSRENKTK